MQTKEKPKDIEGYKKWLKEEHDEEITFGTKKHYEDVAFKVKTDLETSDFWKNFTDNLSEFDSSYDAKSKGYQLLLFDPPPKLLIKGFESFLLKTFRKNILENRGWPKKPILSWEPEKQYGWVLPSNWFSKINDIVRTLIVVKYFDGVEYIANKIHEFCKENNAKVSKPIFMENIEGYYAVHIYITK